jgi:hypothetical protein
MGDALWVYHGIWGFKQAETDSSWRMKKLGPYAIEVGCGFSGVMIAGEISLGAWRLEDGVVRVASSPHEAAVCHVYGLRFTVASCNFPLQSLRLAHTFYKPRSVYPSIMIQFLLLSSYSKCEIAWTHDTLARTVYCTSTIMTCILRPIS